MINKMKYICNKCESCSNFILDEFKCDNKLLDPDKDECMNFKEKESSRYCTKYADGRKEWYKDGKLHRDDGPAIECADGSKHWYKDGKLHRDDGPAIEWANGSKEWYKDGKIIKINTEEDAGKDLNVCPKINDCKSAQESCVKLYSNKENYFCFTPKTEKIKEIKKLVFDFKRNIEE